MEALHALGLSLRDEYALASLGDELQPAPTMRHGKQTKQAQPRQRPPPGADAQPLPRRDRARADQDLAGEGQGGQAEAREADHARPSAATCTPAARRSPSSARTSSWSTSCSRRSRPATRSAPAATRGSSSSARAARTRPRWSSSSSSRLAPCRRRGSTIAYDGSRFAGWAAQPGQRTVQGELESALERILGEQVELTVAGRTDAGVHATGQVASFDARARAARPPAPSGSTPCCPHDVAVLAAAAAPDGFDARRSATRAHLPLPGPGRRPSATRSRSAVRCGGATRSTASLLDAAPPPVVGKHDFTAFTPTQTEHVLFERNVDACAWERRARATCCDADRGAVVHAQPGPGAGRDDARGRRRPSRPRRLRVPARGRARASEAGETAPPHGLYLESVRY